LKGGRRLGDDPPRAEETLQEFDSSRRRIRAPATAALLSALVLGACAQPAQGQPSPAGVPVEARVEAGLLRGQVSSEIAVFKGVPYAAPPVGDLRWRPPAPAAPWTGVRAAEQFGNDCMQTRPFWDATQSKQPVAEDCLTLNIWAPAKARGAPVMVWIHGGGFVMGSGSQPIFDGARLARRGVVVVTFNYRLGRFGFFAHPALTAEAAGGPVGDYGLMDQIAVLRWVQANIAAFGGDPANVTIFGESAGGGSVNQLMAIGAARGLFAKAIAQSGGGHDVWPRLNADLPDKPSAESVGQAFAAKAGAVGSDVAALRAIPAAKVLGGLNLLDQQEKTYSGPMVDGLLVTGSPFEAFAAGTAARVPYLVGANSDELGGIPGFLRGGMSEKAGKALGADLAAVQAAYGSKDALEAGLLSDTTFVEPARSLAGAQAAHGAPTYLYSFGYVAAGKRKPGQGAAHATDVPFVFGDLEALNEPVADDDRRMAGLIGDYWVSFARTGDPNGDGRPAWPAYAPAQDQRLEFRIDGVSAARPSNAAALDAIAAHYRRPKTSAATNR